MKARPGWLLGPCLLCLMASGCVSAAMYHARTADLDRARREAARCEQGQGAALSALQRDLADARARNADLGRRLEEAQAQAEYLGGERDRVSKELDKATLLVGQLRDRLQALGQNKP